MSLESPIQEMKKQAAPKPERSQEQLRQALKKKLLAAKPAIDNGMAEYEKALADGTFEDASGEVAGSGEKRKEALQKKLLGMVERVENMRAQLDSGEELPQTPDDEELSRANEPFMLSTFKDSWSWDVTNLKPEGHTTSPQAQSYEALSQDVDPTKFGAYTLNPETQNLNFEKLTAFVPDLSALEGHPLHEVMQHVVDTYGSTHHIPGIEYWKWLIENPTETPPGANLEDGNWYFCPGSVLRSRGGKWGVPGVSWHGSSFARSADWLTDEWGSYYRVVLLEK